MASQTSLAIDPAARADPYQRYQMPTLHITQLHRNNGQTYLVNATEIAAALARDLSFISKFLAHHLATRSQVKAGQIVLAGFYGLNQLKAALDVFIVNWILCRNCGNPETILSGKDRLSCRACGHSQVL